MLFEANKRVDQIKANTSHKNAGVYDPDGVGGTHVIYVLHDATNPEKYGGLPSNPTVPFMVKMWKGPLKWIGGLAMTFGVLGMFMHYVRFGPKRAEGEQEKKA
jgi:hypothetical protein